MISSEKPSRRRKSLLEHSLAVLIGALSATLTRAFRVHYAPSAPTPSTRAAATLSLGVHTGTRWRLSHVCLQPRQHRPVIERGCISRAWYSINMSCEVSRTRTGGACSWGLEVKRLACGDCLSRWRDPAARWASAAAWSLPATVVERGTETVGGEIGELVQRGRVLNNGEEMRLVAQLEGQKAVVTCPTVLDGSRQIRATNSSAEADHDLVGPKKRKPPTYWVKEDNVRAEIMMFWANLGVESNKVPNQTLLQYFGAHGLRHACGTRGSCQDTAEWLGVEAIPGRWNEALLTREVVQLRESGKLRDDGLIGPRNGATSLLAWARKEWPSQSELERGFLESARKTESKRYGKNYWTTEKNFRDEMMAFNTEFQARAGLPGVWMARPTDMNKSGRRDLVNAIQRAGGYDAAVERMGMVHAMEWRSFTHQLETLRELRDYLTAEGVVQKNMPTLQSLKAKGKTRLKKGIVLMGGRKLVARKMGLNHKPPGNVEESSERDGMSFGRFDLDFAVKILEFVLEREYARSLALRLPKRHHTKSRRSNMSGNKRSDAAATGGGDRNLLGFRQPSILLPKREVFLAEGEETADLVHQIEIYGGYENVARRLHLGYHYVDESAYQEKVGHVVRERNERQRALREEILTLRRRKLAAEQERLAREREIMLSLKKQVQDHEARKEEEERARRARLREGRDLRFLVRSRSL